ncbi:damage-inducible protein [Acidihalobacter aeolianus]|uniref:Damage-inducible protein n=2 Tax=Acidihalobacter TaxID=1765964 RepID=A0A1D8KA58_9GAMM|nr:MULTISPECIES: type ISP restriction/modification enzyme [Acidihalobacter]AOV17821.1 damage-inducible protein [Acidihalobacter aeolianus]OBS10261.1 damage-inducible protein [Acidihalobacter prosperus]
MDEAARPDSIDAVLDNLRARSHDELHKGKLFERLIVQYLKTDPTYANTLAHVWTWAEWPQRPADWKADNTGIDLVGQTHEGTFWAIQCKFYDAGSTLDKAHVSSFLADSAKVFTVDGIEQSFAYRLFVSTTARLGKGAEGVIADQPNFGILYREDLAEAPVDWSELDVLKPEQMKRRTRKHLREHQEEAIRETVDGFAGLDRGKLIMACGTGKTFTALRLNETVTPDTGLTLFLAPSITLVSQTLREWSAEAEQPFDAFVVCSDSRVGREEEDIKTAELAYPATTDARRLGRAIVQAGQRHTRRRVVFSTYQSIQVVIDAQRSGGLPAFDLVICDEAHRTTGLTLPKEDASDFVKVHDNAVLRASKRLYMTATPRIFAEASKTKAGEKNAVLYSMDDEATFGTEFYRLSFGQAVQRDLLAEYKVLIVAVDEDRMASVANSFNNAYKIDEKNAVDIDFATRIIGSWKGLSKQGLKVIDDGEVSDLEEDTAPMRRAVAFSKSIKASHEATKVFADLVRLYRQEHEDDDSMVNATLHHVDGTMNMARRKDELDWLKDEPDAGQCRILSNARCLSEGVDVPALDAVVFFDTRESIVDIVQSVGRVMRKAPDKQYGYIILPVAIPTKKVKDYNSYLESNPQFKGIWKVIKALRAHDERLVDEAEFRRRIKVIGRGKGGKGSEGGGGQLPLDIPLVPVEDIQQAVYAAIPRKLGDREYWAEWAKSVAQIAHRITQRIEKLIERPYSNGRKAFNAYLKGLRKNINPGISEEEAIEMLAQHIITRPVFDALFEGRGFSDDNPISQAMQRIIDHVDDHGVDSETDDLERFYDNVRGRVALAKSDKSRQEIIKNLYDTFFNNAFPRMAERLGIVYTPIEPVDFIVHSVEAVLNKHFGISVSSPDVQIIDPFVGTGTFIVRLLQSGLIKPDDIERKYRNELHANEIVLLAYYVAAVNIETAYHGVSGKNAPFDGIVLTDTFQMYEADQSDHLEGGFSRENAERVERQKKQPIRVVIGNPPYSAGQTSANDNNQNQAYPKLDERIRVTYAAQSSAINKNSLYASEIKAMRWASDRIGKEGVVAFVTNGSFIDGNTADGLRKRLTQEFSHLYVFNLRGNQRTAGELSRKEGGKVFGSGSRNTVAIILMVKNPAHTGPCELFYRDIGDYLDREEKLSRIADFGSVDKVPWTRITPNEAGDWINQRNPEFEGFVALGDKSDKDAATIFETYSRGISTSRDDWAYNFSRVALESNMRRMIDNYNTEVDRYAAACAGATEKPDVDTIVDSDPKRIKWSRGLKSDAERGRKYDLEQNSVVMSIYRPFTKAWSYFNRRLNDMVYQMPRLFPTPRHQNLAISVSGVGVTKDYSCLIVDCVPDLNLIQAGQFFPLYVYEKTDKDRPSGDSDLFQQQDDAVPDSDGYVRRDGITDEALEAYRKHYGDDSITKEDLFYHVYGLLHSPEYRQQYAADLKRMLPRIPKPASIETFRAFASAGRKLADLHLNYETIEPWPLEERYKQKQHGLLDAPEQPNYRVAKMRFPSKKDKSKIIYNSELTLEGIPPEAFEYVVNGKSAIEWVMERYQVTTAKDSSIKNDPNLWCDEHNDPRYIVDLVKRVVRVSVETQRLVKRLPKLDENLRER